MDEHRQAYLAFAARHPDLFENPEGAIFTILLDEHEIDQVEEGARGRLRAKGMPEEWAQVGIAYQDQYLFILRDAVRFPDDSTNTYIRVVDPEGGAHGVIVLAMHQGNVLLLNHFRHATRRWHLEIPRGFGEPGLSGEENARRELEEEIGSSAASITRLILLGGAYPDTGAGTELDDMFLAEVSDYQRPDKNEAISEIRPVPIAQFEEMIRTGEIADGYTLTAYALAKAKGLL